MAKYKVQDIRYEEVYGEICEVKYVQVYTIDSLLSWLEDLKKIHYSVVWCLKHRMILKHNYKSKDYVFIDCKATINIKDNRIFLSYFQPEILPF